MAFAPCDTGTHLPTFHRPHIQHKSSVEDTAANGIYKMIHLPLSLLRFLEQPNAVDLEGRTPGLTQLRLEVGKVVPEEYKPNTQDTHHGAVQRPPAAALLLHSRGFAQSSFLACARDRMADRVKLMTDERSVTYSTSLSCQGRLTSILKWATLPYISQYGLGRCPASRLRRFQLPFSLHLRRRPAVLG